jgi:hypothetical protein
MDLFACPLPESLESIPETDCPIRWDQVQKIGIRRIENRVSLNTTNILLLATFTPLLTAADDTKLLISPYLTNVVITPGEILSEGGNDNTTLNGVPQLRGLGFTSVTAQLKNASSETADALRALTAETASQPGQTFLEVLLFNKDGKIIDRKVSGSDTNLEGFPIYNFTVSDVGSEGFNRDNVNNISWQFAPGWSERHQMHTPTDFNPLTLSNSESGS